MKGPLGGDFVVAAGFRGGFILIDGICGRDGCHPLRGLRFIIGTVPRAYAAWLYAVTRYAGVRVMLIPATRA